MGTGGNRHVTRPSVRSGERRAALAGPARLLHAARAEAGGAAARTHAGARTHAPAVRRAGVPARARRRRVARQLSPPARR